MAKIKCGECLIVACFSETSSLSTTRDILVRSSELENGAYLSCFVTQHPKDIRSNLINNRVMQEISILATYSAIFASSQYFFKGNG